MYQNYPGYYPYPFYWNQEEYLRQMRQKQMRRDYSAQGWTLLIYYGIMTLAVTIASLIDTFIQMGRSFTEAGSVDMDWITNQVLNNSGWGYMLAIGVGFIILLMWKKSAFTFGTIWQRGKPMKVGGFLQTLSIFMSAQMIFMVLSLLVELLLNQAGLTSPSAEAMEVDGLSMFLYAGLGAPISEEILFRGLILRRMEPYGKKFAIFASALLFGLFHGNLSQAPFAFCVGLVLGYVTLEHNIGWAMVLHMFNNLIISDNLTRLSELLPENTGSLLIWAVIGLFTLAAVVILIAQRKKIKAYLQSNQDEAGCAKAFWSAPGIITLVVIMSVSILSSVFAYIMPMDYLS
ncbi:MAG: CPBP family intramembrane metalloprotease [Ruminococcaceae bacterium]|nr:CPBP family intramembrane metalloprotease [Oscillospiraceae bacterium]